MAIKEKEIVVDAAVDAAPVAPSAPISLAEFGILEKLTKHEIGYIKAHFVRYSAKNFHHHRRTEEWRTILQEEKTRPVISGR